MTLNSVVLPAPFGPISPVISPGAHVEVDVGQSARLPPNSHGDVLDARAAPSSPRHCPRLRLEADATVDLAQVVGA